ncbi:MAG TPA: regulatory protein RecX [Actinomycetota bacterium]|nr:regulatory protein RecX [Actinomycetota bacterium]
MKRALRLLAVRARSCKEMRDRLAGAGFEPATVDAVEARLLSAGLLDDSAFAAQVVRRGAETGRSARLTRQDLQRFGVTGDVADTSLTELDLAGSDEERALVLAERKAASCRNVATDRAVARVVRHLCSKGYGPQLAWEVTRKVFRDREFPDD